MILTFSHVVSGQRVPLLDDQGREVTLSVSADTKSDAINSQDVKQFISLQTGIADMRVRGVE